MTRVAIIDDIHDAFRDLPPVRRLRQRAQVVIFTTPLTEDQRAEALDGVDVVVPLRERSQLDEDFFEDVPSLKLVSQTGRAGPHIDREAATRAGVLIAEGRGPGSSSSTIELTFALMMAIMRRIPQSDALLRRGAWKVPYGIGLEGKRLGLIGFGRIGKIVGQVGVAFGMDVLAWSKNMTNERAAEVGARAATLDEIMRSSDVVSVHLALNEGTRGLVSGELLGLMKPDAYFINTARAAVTDERALVDLLRERKIAGAALDVFEKEPIPIDHPLLHMDNVVLTPHIGWPADNSYARFAEGAVANIEAWLEGEPTNIVNPEAAANRTG
jgi:phosphoglycerate dehydrogenase-like enzyme